MDKYKKPKHAPMNADLPFIKCATCERMVLTVLKEVTTLVDAANKKAPKKAQTRRFESSSNLGGLEESVEDVLAKVCDPENDGLKEYGKERRSASGKWLAAHDVAKSTADRRKLVLEPKDAGHCRRECRTIAKACESVMERVSADDDTDLASYLISALKEKLSVGTVQQRVCTKIAGVCKKGAVPLWPEGKPRKNEQFKPKTEQDLKTEEMLATMAGEHGNGITMMQPGDYELPGSENRAPDEIDVLKDEL